LKVVKIVNSEENPEDEEPDCICSGVNLRVKDKNDVVSRHLKIFMELCIKLYCKEHDTQCTVHHALCDKPSKDFYGTVRIRLFVKLIFLQRSCCCPC